MSKPLVTVIVDTFNHERFIAEAVVSVLEQDFSRSEMEILVIDDGSTDRTPEILRKFEPQVRILRKRNGGQASAFNASIPEARGEYIAFLDGDDWWLPNKLSRVMEAFERGADLGLVGHGLFMSYLDGREMRHTLHEECRFQVSTVEAARLFRVRKAFLGTSRMTFRSALLRRILPVPEALTFQADEYLFTLGAVLSQVNILADSLMCYRIHDSNAFQLSSQNLHKLKRKQEVLAALANKLRDELQRLDLPKGTIRAIVDYLRAEADQLRLMIAGGWTWETVRTEWTISEAMFEDASFSYRIFKLLSLIPALAVPPRVFYGARQKLAESSLYRRARQKWLPIPEMSHIEKNWGTTTR